MTFNFSFREKVRIDMTQYISKIIAEFPKEILGKAATPGGDTLFKM
jgi:hypothetical protein